MAGEETELKAGLIVLMGAGLGAGLEADVEAGQGALLLNWVN